MLALSIRQPWAWAIIHAGKDIENRSWRTYYRGRFPVHAAKGMTRREYSEAIGVAQDIARIDWPHPDSLQYGGIIGIVTLTDCVTDSVSPWFFGPYGFVLRHAEPLDFHELSGQRKFFEVDGEWA